jgi:hypothetical protein
MPEKRQAEQEAFDGGAVTVKLFIKNARGVIE